MKKYNLPLTDDDIRELNVGDQISLSGIIYTGRDAVLPKIVKLIEEGTLDTYDISLVGSVIFHTAVSVAGVGPTSSNKLEIEGNIPALSKAGVKLHLGKGALSQETISALNEHNSVYAVIPPVTALLESKIKERHVLAFPEDGMEAFHALNVIDLPVIIAAAKGKSIYDK